MTARRNATKAPANTSTTDDTDGPTTTATLAPVPTDDTATATTDGGTDTLVSATDGPTDDMTLDPNDGPALGDDVSPATAPVIDYATLAPEAVGPAYAVADASNKAKMRKTYTDAIGAALRTGDMAGAIAAQARLDACVASGPSRKAAPVIDYTARAIAHAMTLAHALNTFANGNATTTDGNADKIDFDAVRVAVDAAIFGTGDDACAKASVADMFVTVPEGVTLGDVSPLRSVRVRDGKTAGRSVAAHVAEWAGSVPVGTFGLVSEIANFRSTVYGSDKVSQGAVAAHLFPTDKDGNATDYAKTDATGVTPVDATGTTARGAKVTAHIATGDDADKSDDDTTGDDA